MSDSTPRQVELPDGTSLSVSVDSNDPRPALIWGHGLSSSMASEEDLGLVDWASAAPAHRVIRYDARGHGASDSTPTLDDYRWDRLAADQLALADALGVGRYVAAGASMGCATALYAALAAPTRIDALVLVIPPTGWETRRDQVDMYEQMAQILDAGRVELLVAGVDASPTPDPFVGRDDWKDRTRNTLRTADPERLARVFRGAGRADLPDRAALATIDQPTLILAWSGDPGHPVSSAEQLEALLPNSSLHVASTPDDIVTWSGLIADVTTALSDSTNTDR